jgi:hypothetical protein
MMKPKSVRIAEAQVSTEMQAKQDAITLLFLKTAGNGGVGVEEYNDAAKKFNSELSALGLSALQMVFLDENGKVKI